VRLLIGAGGTGGGVYPALAVLQALKDNVEVLWVGTQRGMESALVQRAGIKFEAIPAGGLHGVSPREFFNNMELIVQGYFASKRILKSFKPDVIFLTGGYIGFPIAMASGCIPLALFVPDIEPGLALKGIAGFSDCIAVVAKESLGYFKRHKNIFVSGYPTRADLPNWDRLSARRHFNLDESLPVLLIFGGSLGARSINKVILNQLASLLKITQVIHISGELDWQEVIAKRTGLTSEQSSRYHAFPYLHEEMGAALASSDLVVSRSGASILGEFPLFGLTAILVPYPHAWRYQNVNAQYLASRGAAIVLEDSRLGLQLLPTIKQMLENPNRLKEMRSTMQSLSNPQAAAMIGQRLLSMAGTGS
jgi:undecaprenyldiphospho-muramoylpentapeptide beta-N-acetylglucosaminyltransferase